MGTASFKISNLQLSFSGLAALESGQRGIASFLAAAAGPSNAKSDIEEMEVESRPLGKRSRSDQDQDFARRSATPLAPPTRAQDKAPSGSSTPTSFQCGRCKKIFALSRAKLLLDDEGRAEALRKLSAEHDDFHVAEDLAREVIDVSSSPSPEPKKPPAKRKKAGKGKQSDQGIARYFGAPPKK